MSSDVFYERKHVRQALATCAACPIQKECLEGELQLLIRDQHGVRGGVTAKDRKNMIRVRRLVEEAARVASPSIAAVIDLPHRPAQTVVSTPASSGVAA